MIRRLALVVAWLLAGHAVLAALFWGLVHVPESTVWMLALSALLAVAIAIGAAWVHAGAALAWRDERPALGALRDGWRGLPAVAIAATLFAFVWWATGLAMDAHTLLRGQMDATVMARTGSTHTALLHTAIEWTLLFVRWTIGLSAALALLGAWSAGGLRALATPAWIGRALHWRTWIVLTGCFVVLLVLPWQLAYWRPAWVPATGVEIAFAAVKLGVMAVLAATGWALMLRRVARG